MKKRNTWQKESILKVIRNSDQHPTINEIYDHISHNYKIGKATVYRNINEMVEEGKIKKISYNGVDHYDGIMKDHYHIMCKECKKIVDVFDSNIDALKSDISNKNNISIDQIHIIIDGLCSLCKNKKEGR